IKEGQRVAAGDPLLILEAMKMENELVAPVAGIVTQIAVATGETVEKGTLLVRLEPS
ncbi:MAG: acetyl-CoA carboxylase biotin carboxyl carrier protein subunit, partial [Acidobacteria bacterium]|nr:acetyl-CoA carboxylase biotin carboxyl carrier protein subunit [Acidobacteriota bacterium]